MILADAIAAYREQFGEGPPIWGMDENEAIAAIEKALSTGRPITQTSEQMAPGDAYL